MQTMRGKKMHLTLFFGNWNSPPVWYIITAEEGMRHILEPQSWERYDTRAAPSVSLSLKYVISYRLKACDFLSTQHWLCKCQKDLGECICVYVKRTDFTIQQKWKQYCISTIFQSQVARAVKKKKKTTCQCRKHKRRGFSPWVGKIPGRMAW